MDHRTDAISAQHAETKPTVIDLSSDNGDSPQFSEATNSLRPNLEERDFAPRIADIKRRQKESDSEKARIQEIEECWKKGRTGNSANMMQEKKAETLVRVEVPLVKAGNARKQREDATSSSKALSQHSNPYFPKDKGIYQ